LFGIFQVYLASPKLYCLRSTIQFIVLKSTSCHNNIFSFTWHCRSRLLFCWDCVTVSGTQGAI
jgi:hypothetical protein